MAHISPAALKLSGFIERNRIPKRRAAAALGVTHPALFDWLAGHKVPGPESRKAIEIWTNGEVQALEWGLTRSERDGLERLAEVQPFEPPTGTDGN